MIDTRMKANLEINQFEDLKMKALFYRNVFKSKTFNLHIFKSSNFQIRENNAKTSNLQPENEFWKACLIYSHLF